MTLSLFPSLTVSSRPSKPYVLVVDDHLPSLRRMSQVIEGAGHCCVIAETPSRALSYCEACRPQVVITDLKMPNLDGRGLASWLSSRFPSVPLLLMTGERLDASDIALLRRKFTAVFTKPVDVEWFLECLDRLMPPNSFSRRP